MFNIYIIALTLVVLYVLDMLWKNINLKNKVIEGFAGTANTTNTTTPNIITKFSGDEASITPKLKASSISTTGNLDVGGVSQFNNRVNFGTLIGNNPIDVNIMGRESKFETEAISNFNNVVNIYDNLNVGNAEDPKDITLNGKSIQTLIRENQPTNSLPENISVAKNLTVGGISQFNDNVTIGSSASPKNLTLNGNMNLTGTITSGGKTIDQIVAANTSGNFSTDVTIQNDKLLTAGRATFNDNVTIVNTKGINTSLINGNNQGPWLDISASAIRLLGGSINMTNPRTIDMGSNVQGSNVNIMSTANFRTNANFNGGVTFNGDTGLAASRSFFIGPASFKWDPTNNKLVLTLPNDKKYEWS